MMKTKHEYDKAQRPQKGDKIKCLDSQFYFRGEMKIEEIFEDEEKVMVHFRLVRHPKNKIKGILSHLPEEEICDKCGCDILSPVSSRGEEIVCVRCNHGHGFDEKYEIFPLDKLENLTAKRREIVQLELLHDLDIAKYFHLISDEEENKIRELIGAEKPKGKIPNKLFVF